MAQECLLEISALTKSFGGVHALNSVDLSLAPGETLGIIGPNGSGKTTLFNVITGLVRADAGTARWNGEKADLLRLPAWQVFRLGLARTFQNIRLTLGETVLDNVSLGRHLQVCTPWWAVLAWPGETRRRDHRGRKEALEALRFVAPHLAERPDRLVGELSYADRRRVELARAVAAKPRLLLLDEPTAGMNPRETDEIGDDIRKIAAGGMAILVIEHKMKFVASLASRIAVLNFGRKIAEGSYETVRGDPQVIASYLGRKGDHLNKTSHRKE